MTSEKANIHLLRLSAVPGVGPNKMRALIGKFKSASEVFRASKSDLATVTGIDQKTAENIKSFDGTGFAEEQFKQCDKLNATFLTFWDKAYPPLLKQIYDPPVILYVKGSFTNDDRNAVAIVGTRNPTNYGKLVANKLASELAAKGLPIVSGLAYGVDTIAHESALNSGGRTLAVIGSGLDVIYPAQNKKLCDRIVESGVVISEFPFGTGPDRQNFPRRNRIICGLSHGIIVIEAGLKSGALITANIALEQNREVFAVPGNITSNLSFGTNELIKQGARVVTGAEDILDELSGKISAIANNKSTKPIAVDLTDEEKILIQVLSHEPKHIDTIALEIKQSTSRILSTLLTLELKNQVKQLTGKMFVRV